MQALTERAHHFIANAASVRASVAAAGGAACAGAPPAVPRACFMRGGCWTCSTAPTSRQTCRCGAGGAGGAGELCRQLSGGGGPAAAGCARSLPATPHASLAAPVALLYRWAPAVTTSFTRWPAARPSRQAAPPSWRSLAIRQVRGGAASGGLAAVGRSGWAAGGAADRAAHASKAPAPLPLPQQPSAASLPMLPSCCSGSSFLFKLFDGLSAATRLFAIDMLGTGLSGGWQLHSCW